MKRLWLAALAALALYCPPASAKTVMLCTGLFGEMVAPMSDYDAPLKEAGHKVIRASHRALPNKKPDWVISHSACADIAPQAYPKAKHAVLDGTWAGRGCPKGTSCDNYYAPINKLPFFLCCGGYPTRGSARTYKQPGTFSFFIFAPGHIGLPSRVRDQVIRSIK